MARIIFGIFLLLLPMSSYAQSPFFNPYTIEIEENALLDSIDLSALINQTIKNKAGNFIITGGILSSNGLVVVPSKNLESLFFNLPTKRFLANSITEGTDTGQLFPTHLNKGEEITGKILSNISPDFPARKRSAFLKNNIKLEILNRPKGAKLQKEIYASFDSTRFYQICSTNHTYESLLFYDPAKSWAIMKVRANGSDTIFNQTLKPAPKISSDSQQVLIIGYPNYSFYNELPDIRVATITTTLPIRLQFLTTYYSILETYDDHKRNFFLVSFIDQLKDILDEVPADFSKMIRQQHIDLLAKVHAEHPYRTTYQQVSSLSRQWQELMRANTVLEQIIYNTTFSRNFFTLERDIIQNSPHLQSNLDRYFSQLNEGKEQELLGFYFQQLLTHVPQQYWTKRMANNYLSTGKSIPEWSNFEFYSSLFSSKASFEKMQQSRVLPTRDLILQDNLYLLWNDLQSIQSTINQSIIEINHKLSKIKSDYFDALASIDSDFYAHADANGSVKIALGQLIKDTDNQLVVQSQLTDGFSGGQVFDLEGNWLGMIPEVSTPSFSFQHFSAPHHYEFIPASEIMKLATQILKE